MEIHPFPALFLFAQSYLTDAVIVIFSDYCFTDTYLSRGAVFCVKKSQPKAPSLRELSPPKAVTEGVPRARALANFLRHGSAVPPPSKREALGAHKRPGFTPGRFFSLFTLSAKPQTPTTGIMGTPRYSTSR